MSSFSAKLPLMVPAPWQLLPPQCSWRMPKPSQAPDDAAPPLPASEEPPASPALALPPRPPDGVPSLREPAAPTLPLPYVSSMAASNSSLMLGVLLPAQAANAPDTKQNVAAPSQR